MGGEVEEESEGRRKDCREGDKRRICGGDEKREGGREEMCEIRQVVRRQNKKESMSKQNKEGREGEKEGGKGHA